MLKRLLLVGCLVGSASIGLLSQALTASITAAPATVSVVVAAKTYDGNTSATVMSCTVSGTLAGDVVTCSATASFVSKQAGTARPWTAVVTKSGADAANYTVPTSATGTADITKKTVSLPSLVALDKVYDRTTVAMVNASGGLVGVIAPDACAFDPATVSATFADKNVGTNKPVTVSGTAGLTGADCGNYTLTSSGGGSPPPVTGLVTQANLQYVGAFRLPYLGGAGSDQSIPPAGAVYNQGASAMGYNAARNSLILRVDIGLNQYNDWLGEVSIPTPLTGVQCVRTGAGCSGTELNEGSVVQWPAPLLAGLLNASLGCNSGRMLRGVLVDGPTLYLSGYVNYDGCYIGSQSHFKRALDFASVTASGPFELNAFGVGNAMNGGAGGGFQVAIPTAWQASLGGDTLASNWNISVNARASWGPSAIIYHRADIGVTNPIPATPLLYYNDAHATLGRPQQEFTQWNDTGLNESGTGVVFVEGTPSILFINAHTDHPCYGVGTTDPSLAGQPTGSGDIYCLDYEVASKGNHGNPWTQRVLAYDVRDLVAVKQGTKQPWDVVPYASWDFTFPQFQATHFIRSLAYDPAHQLIYLAAQYGDPVGCCYNAPIIHVYRVTL